MQILDAVARNLYKLPIIVHEFLPLSWHIPLVVHFSSFDTTVVDFAVAGNYINIFFTITTHIS